jgi:hypothetical protein
VCPQGEEGRSADISTKSDEQAAMSLEFKVKFVTKCYGEPEQKNCLPSEFGWTTFFPRWHIGGNQGPAAGPFAELIRGEASEFGCQFGGGVAQSGLVEFVTRNRC